MSVAFCTIVTADFLPYAVALSESIERFGAGVLYVLVVDESPNVCHHVVNSRFVFVKMADLLGDSVGEKIVEKYGNDSGGALRWSLKPVLMRYLLDERNISGVFWIDPDTRFYSDYGFLVETLNDCGILLSPHWKPYHKPGVCTRIPYSEHTEFGLFNAGFVGATERGRAALDWWANACLYACHRDTKEGIYDDQKYLDVMSVYFDFVRILRHKGCNVAHWNDIECHRSIDQTGVTIAGSYEIVFIHYAVPYPDLLVEGFDCLIMPLFLEYLQGLYDAGLRDFGSLFQSDVNVFCIEMMFLCRSRAKPIHVVTDFPHLQDRFKSIGMSDAVRVESVERLLESEEGGNTFAALINTRSEFTVEHGTCARVFRWSHMQKSLPSEKCKSYFQRFLDGISIPDCKICLFGAGKHTVKILGYYYDLGSSRIVCIYDECSQLWGKFMGGIVIQDPCSFEPDTCDYVVISSDANQDLLHERATSYFPGEKIIQLYGPAELSDDSDGSAMHATIESR